MKQFFSTNSKIIEIRLCKGSHVPRFSPNPEMNITEMEVLISKFMASPEPIPPYGVPEGGIQLCLTLLIHRCSLPSKATPCTWVSLCNEVLPQTKLTYASLKTL